MPERRIGQLPRRDGGRDGRADAAGGRGRYHSVATAFEVGAGTERNEEESCRSNRRNNAGDCRRHKAFGELFSGGPLLGLHLSLHFVLVVVFRGNRYCGCPK